LNPLIFLPKYLSLVGESLVNSLPLAGLADGAAAAVRSQVRQDSLGPAQFARVRGQ